MEKQAAQLLAKYKQGDCSPAELAMLHRWYFTAAKKLEMPEGPADPLQEEALLWERIRVAASLKDIQKVKAKKAFNYTWLAMAASIILLLSIGLYLYSSSLYDHEAAMARLRAHDITPGTNKAVLTLSDGTKVVLNEQINGEIAKQGGVSIQKTADGQLIYMVKDNEKSKAASNTISTPKGGQYQVNLPDGTRVWLNAMSSLTFPTSFTGKGRFVRLKGEGYFEVTRQVVHEGKDKKLPFTVLTDHEMVQVTGTRFNVSSYADEESTKTTLLEGSVNVGSQEQSPEPVKMVTLKANEQAEFKNGGLKVRQVNADEVVAWKNGKFKFSNENIESLMKKVARWYDVEVVYKGKISKEGFGGQVSRSRNISEILEVLQLTRLVHFEIEGRRVIVSSE